MFTLNCRGNLLAIDKPIVMGIVNLTPDSFYRGSRVTEQSLLEKVENMLAEGATIIDMGGQSTRPGSEEVGVDEELKRIIPAIETVIRHFPGVILSIDTYHSTIARAAVDEGAAIINDVSGGSFDKNMLETVAQLDVPYICMHIKGKPATMQKEAVYENILQEILDYFIDKLDQCKKLGINDVIIDPGFGFAKNIAQNFQVLKSLEILKILDRPILAGLSRKSTISKTLNISAEESLNGSTVLHTIALLNGAAILRVHDVKEAMQAIELVEVYSAVNED